MKIVVDAMGGDKAPEVVVEGAVKAAIEYKLNIELAGISAQLEPLLTKYKYPKELISLCPASEVIQMSEPPALSIRRKKDSSIWVGLNSIKERRADAFVSAGNTGACVAACQLLKGLEVGS